MGIMTLPTHGCKVRTGRNRQCTHVGEQSRRSTSLASFQTSLVAQHSLATVMCAFQLTNLGKRFTLLANRYVDLALLVTCGRKARWVTAGVSIILASNQYISVIYLFSSSQPSVHSAPLGFIIHIAPMLSRSRSGTKPFMSLSQVPTHSILNRSRRSEAHRRQYFFDRDPDIRIFGTWMRRFLLKHSPYRSVRFETQTIPPSVPVYACQLFCKLPSLQSLSASVSPQFLSLILLSLRWPRIIPSLVPILYTWQMLLSAQGFWLVGRDKDTGPLIGS